MKTVINKTFEGGLKMVRKTFLVLVLCILMVPASHAMTQEERDDLNEILTFFRSIDFTFSVDTTYQYVFDKPDGMDITDGSRPLYQGNNTFDLNAFTISVEKSPSFSDSAWDLFGFRTDILFGQQADLLAADGLFSDDTIVDIYQGYLHLLLPFGENGINIYAGKFVTLAGYEVIEARYNPNITRSFLFGNAIPFTHTGIRASTELNGFEFTVGLNNGWDVVSDNNESKTFEAQIAYSYAGSTITDSWIGVTGYFGREDDLDDGFRSLVTVVGEMTLMDMVTFIADLDFGWETNVIDIGGDDAFWWGIAGYAVMDLHPALGFALRAEYFDDQDGVRLGEEISVISVTPTIHVRPFKGLITANKFLDNMEWRFEYRWDRADEPFFIKENGDLSKNQHGVMAQVLYWIDI